jgi:hypothetical protein
MRQPIVSAIILALGLPIAGFAMDQAAPQQQAPAAAPQVAQPAAPQAPKAPDFNAMDKERADFMKAKHERMSKIWGTNDPNERQKLIDEDRKAMQEHREKMRSLSGMPEMPARGGEFEGDMMPPPMMGRPEGRMPPRPNMERPPMPPMMGMGHHGRHQDVIDRLDKIEKTLNEMAGKKTQ